MTGAPSTRSSALEVATDTDQLGGRALAEVSEIS
jgi:hypothetical protein